MHFTPILWPGVGNFVTKIKIREKNSIVKNFISSEGDRKNRQTIIINSNVRIFLSKCVEIKLNLTAYKSSRNRMNHNVYKYLKHINYEWQISFRFSSGNATICAKVFVFFWCFIFLGTNFSTEFISIYVASIVVVAVFSFSIRFISQHSFLSFAAKKFWSGFLFIFPVERGKMS